MNPELPNSNPPGCDASVDGSAAGRGVPQSRGRRSGWAWIALIGLVPGLGDALTTALSVYIVREAARFGVPRATLPRMLANVGLDLAAGTIPARGRPVRRGLEGQQDECRAAGCPPAVHNSPRPAPTARGVFPTYRPNMRRRSWAGHSPVEAADRCRSASSEVESRTKASHSFWKASMSSRPRTDLSV